MPPSPHHNTARRAVKARPQPADERLPRRRGLPEGFSTLRRRPWRVRRCAQVFLAVAIALYGIVGFPTPDDPEPPQAAADPQSGIVCETVYFMGTPIERCAFLAHIPHSHNPPPTDGNGGGGGGGGGGGDPTTPGGDPVSCGANQEPAPGGGCIYVYGDPSRCDAAGLEYDSVSELCIGSAPECDLDENPQGCDADAGPGRGRECNDPREADFGDGCEVVSDPDGDRSQHCPAGQTFYSQIGCSYPCSSGQILVSGSCHAVSQRPQQPGTNPPAQCPVGYGGTPPNCVEGTPEIVVLDSTVDESTGTVDVIVALSHRGTTDSTVNFTTSDDTATSGADYTSVTQSVTVPANSQTATVPVPIIDDTDDETYRETFTVTISGVSGGATMGTKPSGAVTILDDDYPPTVSVTGGDTMEGDTSSDGAYVRFVVSLDRAVSKDVTVTVNTADGTATAGDDYTALVDDTATITAGNTSVRVNVYVLEDSTVEPDETFTVTLSDPVNAVVGPFGTATGTILNDDPSGWNGVCSVDPVTGDYRLAVRGGSYPTSLHAEHIRWGWRWTDPNGVAVVTADITTGVTYTATLYEYYRGRGYFGWITASRSRGLTATAVCTTPPPEWRISVSDWSVDEDGGFAYVTVSLNGPSVGVLWLSSVPTLPKVIVTLDTSDVTATASDDYDAVTAETVTIEGGHLQATVRVPITDDLVSEPDETFTATISNPQGEVFVNCFFMTCGTLETPDPVLGDDTATVTILDNDIPLPQATISSDVSVDEGAGTAVFTVTIDKVWTSDVTVGVDTRDGTATAGDDYTALAGQAVTIAVGDTSATFSVNITDDTADEPDETFDVVLSWSTNATLGAPSSATATIADDDAAPVVSVSDVSFDEDYSVALNPPFDIDGDGISDDEYIYTLPVDVTVELSNPSARQVTVRASTTDDTAVGTTSSCPSASANTGTADYRSATQNLTFTPGETQKTFTVRGCPDIADEGDETFSVELSNAVNATLGTDATGTILDNDIPPPEVSIADASADEDSSVTFDLTLDATTTRVVTVVATTAPSSPVSAAGVAACVAADGSDDYESDISTVTFAANTTTATFTVTLCDDTAHEPDETFTVTLSSPTNAALGMLSTATGTILDDDETTVSISGPSVAVDEDTSGVPNSLTFTVTLNVAGVQTVTVNVATSSGTATGGTCGSAGIDFVSQTTTLTFTAGDTSEDFTVATCADTVSNEGTEDFTVTISGPTNATLGTSSATGQIVDNDGPAIYR